MEHAPDPGPVTLDDGGALLCPRCNSNYTHHGPVRAFMRRREDGDGMVTEVNGLRSTTRYASHTELPHRRNTVRVHIWCEDCDATDDGPDESGAADGWTFAPDKGLVLEIEQHKGQTLLRWLSVAEAR